MSENQSNPSVKMPPLENWAAQTFAYGFLLDRSASLDYTGNAAPNQSGRSGFAKPEPDDLHLLNLNPQSLHMSEPFATAVLPSQGGGKFVESHGGVMKSLSIRGTTGFMPPVAPYAQHMKTPAQMLAEVGAANLSEFELAQTNLRQSNQTGFFEFYRLRKLFRQYMLEKRQGRSVQMHWLDFKGDEFWSVEPMSFDLERGRFTYTYDIKLNLLEPSQLQFSYTGNEQGFDTKDLRGIVNRDFGKEMLKNPLNGALDSQQTNLLSRLSQMSSSAKQFVQNFALGVVTLKFQSAIKAIGAIQSFFADISAIRRATLDTALNLYKQANSAVQGLADSFDDVTPAAFKRDINEWVIEAKMITEGLMSNHLVKFASNPGRGFADENAKYTQPLAVGGTKNAFITETVNSARVTNTGSGLALLGNIEQMVNTTALRAEDVLTGETIFDVAQRLLGDAQRFVDLVIVNRLKPPFIVGSTQNKTPGTIAWGEKVLVPASDSGDMLSVASPVQPSVGAFGGTVDIDVSTTQFLMVTPEPLPYRDDMWSGFTITWLTGLNAGESRVITSNVDQLDGTTMFTVNRALSTVPQPNDTFSVSLQLFTSRVPVTPETSAFGKDIMGVFTKVNGNLVDGTVDVMLGPTKDLAVVQGIENLEQAVTLALQTRRGSNKSNPTYGTSDVIGRPMEPNILALNVFYVRQSLLQDPRISSVERPKVQYIGTALYFTVYVRPVRVQRTLFLRIPL